MPIAASKAAREQFSSGPLILNVDDRPAQLYVRDRILRQHGYAVKNVATAREAMEAARELRPRLILLDIHLPDADGRDLCQQIKAEPELAAIPVVLISASLSGGHAETLDSVRWGNADGFIHEPVDADALVSLVRSAINHAA